MPALKNIHSDRHASDYKRSNLKVLKNDQVTVRMEKARVGVGFLRL
jgi:hypothetical protein